MDQTEYKATLRKFEQVSRKNLKDRADWVSNRALPWLWSELASIAGQKRLKALSPENAIRKGLETTPVERINMPLQRDYYTAHMTMLDAEAKRVCAAAAAFEKSAKPFAPNATILELQSALKSLLLDGLVLLQEAHSALQKKPGPYGIGKNRDDHPFQIFKGAEQFIYGRYSGLTHTDQAP
ncbi:MAG: hypothetical protein WAM62_10210, partial [Pseudolabrys sp.]